MTRIPLARTGAAVAVLFALALPTSTATAATTAATVVSATVPTAASGTALTCRITTAAGHPVAFHPALTTRPRSTRVTGTFHLSDCTSPDRTQSRVKRGVLTINGTMRASCTGAGNVSGSGTLTWYDRRGHRLGTSKLRPASTTAGGYNPGNALLSGTVTRGILNGTHAKGNATPTSDITACATRGLRTLTGAGTVRFQR